jgi:hypothetical protein
VRAIQRANRLKSTLIMAKKSYRIPQTGVPSPQSSLGYPPRRLPPTTPAAIATLETAGTAGKR